MTPSRNAIEEERCIPYKVFFVLACFFSSALVKVHVRQVPCGVDGGLLPRVELLHVPLLVARADVGAQTVAHLADVAAEEGLRE